MFKKLNDKDRKRLHRKIHIRKSVYGTAERPRMTVTRSNKNISVQVIDDDEGKTLMLNLGFSNDIFTAIPEGLTVVADAAGKLSVTGISKQQVGEFCAEIRKLRMPEPYKGKGIRYEDEVIRRKVGKTGVK